jgi:hypothetical protein
MEKNNQYAACTGVLPNCTSNARNVDGPSTTKYASLGK